MKDLQRYGSIKVREWDPFLVQCLFTDVYMTPRQGGKILQYLQVLFSYTYDHPIYDVTSGCKVAVLFLREACLTGVGLFFGAKEEVSRRRLQERPWFSIYAAKLIT